MSTLNLLVLWSLFQFSSIIAQLTSPTQPTLSPSPTVEPTALTTPPQPTTELPTQTPTPQPTPNPTQIPTLNPIVRTPNPTEFPTTNPTEIPTEIPTNPTEIATTEMPTPIPTEFTEILTETPTSNPTEIATTEMPTPILTEFPTEIPTSNPTEITTKIPTSNPTEIPTEIGTTETPTPNPTQIPTEIGTTEIPTSNPTEITTEIPTSNPTQIPTEIATEISTQIPTKYPTSDPTLNPTEIATTVTSKIPTYDVDSQCFIGSQCQNRGECCMGNDEHLRGIDCLCVNQNKLLINKKHKRCHKLCCVKLGYFGCFDDNDCCPILLTDRHNGREAMYVSKMNKNDASAMCNEEGICVNIKYKMKRGKNKKYHYLKTNDEVSDSAILKTIGNGSENNYWMWVVIGVCSFCLLMILIFRKCRNENGGSQQNESGP